ncbi:MAG: undecaprenyl-diphosphatase UppP [Chloroflexi bacterium]|nr:undecaprenyl-diphosphatase UppP [Chloroflexota bacterium]
MTLLQAIFLGVLQGATEFLPVSSSGHLVVVPWLLGWPSPGLTFDTMVHWGTLLAVVLYFWRDLLGLALAWLASLRERSLEGDPRRLLAWLIILGTIPAALAGFLLQDVFESLFGQPHWVAFFWIITGLILFGSEKLGRRQRDMADLGWLDALLIGIAQAIAVTPGISRSGSTMGMGLLRNMEREPAARFSFLLMTPIVFGAGLLQLVHLLHGEGGATPIPFLVAGFLAAAITGFVCIAWLLRYLQKNSLTLFAFYCWIAGAVTLLIAFAGWR